MGLDDSYANIRGQILLMQPLPSVVKAYNMVRHEEKQREGLLPKPATSVFAAFGSQQRSQTYGSNNGQQRFTRSNGESSERRSSFRKGLICENCSKEGHSKD